MRTSLGYLALRNNEPAKAEQILNEVVRDDPNLRMAYPTLAMCYVQLGEKQRAEALIDEATLHASEADGEMSYRLATYFAVCGNKQLALRWLRKAIDRGNHNYPWFSTNPAWKTFHKDTDFVEILKEVHRDYIGYRRQWKQILAG